MLKLERRTAILELKEQGNSIRAIARALKMDRDSVRKVLRGETGEPPPRYHRQEAGAALHDDILELYRTCKENLVRVHEELVARGATLSYQSLTSYCRRHGIGEQPRLPEGEYHFLPGEESQHDTSPHRVQLGGRTRVLQCASLVLAHSRMVYAQYFPTFNRFWCKVFLTDAFRFFGGACSRCIIDNTHVVVAQGTGRNMIPAPEMEVFGERFGFVFRAHELRHPDRKGRVEAPFAFLENNFLAGREFQDWADLNRQARAWCEKVNASPKRHLHARPIDLFALEQGALQPLPLWVPTVYRLENRTVDGAGYVNLDGNRYSVPYQLVGRRLEVRVSAETIEVFKDQDLVASHAHLWDARDQKFIQPEHRPKRGEGRPKAGASPDELELLRREPLLAGYVTGIKAHPSGRISALLRRLLGMVQDYPRQPLLKAIDTALAYRLFDLDRLERMVLKNVQENYFELGQAVPLPFDPALLGESRER
jgi:transposase